MKTVQWLLLLLTPILISTCTKSTTKISEIQPISEAVFSLDDNLPMDPAIIKKKLENGLIYYIRKNEHPENRAELRLVINAGSILEDDDQQGLAHFCEHMAFNGTKNFKKQELVNYLETIGMRFGPEINAYTSFDETVYMLELPTDSSEIIETGFQVLEDWAHLVSYDDEEINKERGVVVEEWRLGRGARARMRDTLFPVLFHNSRYAERLPIGKKEVLDSFSADKPRRFYKDWYRPNNMALVVVGDVEVERIEKLIQKHFNGLANAENQRERKMYNVPEHQETLFGIASDPEATQTIISLYFKMPSADELKIGDYRKSILEGLYVGMMNNRLDEHTQQEDPPFIFAYFTKGRMVRTSEYYALAALVKEDGIERGLDILLTEARRVQLFGFNQSELQRQKTSAMRGMEKAWKERDKIESAQLAAEYIRNFLFAEPLPGIDYEYKLYQKLLPDISIDELNTLAKDWTTSTSRVVTLETIDKEGSKIPTEENLQKIMDQVQNKTIEPYVDDVLDVPLVDVIPDKKKIVSESFNDSLGYTEWLLPSGARVFAKKTDFKNDEIRFSASSFGGLSLYPDSVLIPGQTAISVISEGGLGSFNLIQLQKALSGKVVQVSPFINETKEGLSGQASPTDLETLFQLVYLYFTSPRKDSTSFVSMQSRYMAYYQNRNARPETAWRDTISATISQGHPRYKPLNAESFKKMNLDLSHKIYNDRFAESGDFVFFFVGNFDVDVLRDYAETYLANLPSMNRVENWRDVTYDYPEGVIEKRVKKGSEPKSQNSIIFTGDFEWSRENRYKSSSMIDVLRIKLRERIREDLGGTYGVRVKGSFARIPRSRYRITIEFGCDPDRIEELTSEIFTQIDSLVNFGTTDKYLLKIKEADLRGYEKNIKENSFWISNLEYKLSYNDDPMDILTYPDLVESLSLEDIHNAARNLLNKENFIRVVLVPDETQRVQQE